MGPFSSHIEVRLAVPARYFGHPRMVDFFQALLAEFAAARKRRLPGYSFEPLGRTRPLKPRHP